MILRALRQWIDAHPARAGTIAGWYQQGCGAIATLVLIPLVIKRLTPETAGLWFCFQNTLAIINLTDFGLSFVVARQVSYSLHALETNLEPATDFLVTRAGWAGVTDVYQASCKLFQKVSLAGVILLALGYHLILPLGNLLTNPTHETAIAWYLLGVSALLSLQAKPHLAVVEGLAKVYWTRILGGTAQLLTGFAVITALLLGGRLVEMAFAVAVVSVFYYVASRLLLRAMAGPQLSQRLELTKGFLRRFFKVAVPMGVLNLSGFMVSSIQVPLLGFLLGPQVVPGFFLAQRIGQMLNQGIFQIVSPQMPLFTREVAREDRSAALKRLLKTVVIVTCLALVVNVAFYFLSPFLVELWVGPGRYIAPIALVVLSIDYFFMSSSVVWAQFVLAGGSNPFVWSTLCSGLLNLLLIWMLVPRFSVAGAAFAGLLTGVLINYWYVIYRGLLCFRKLQFSACTR